MSDALGLGYLVGMTAAIAFGAVVPVIPTGAAVSVAAALGGDNPFLFAAVVVFGSVRRVPR